MLGTAERHWRELGKPLHIHRILLQRSWIAIFRGRFADAVELIAQGAEWLDSSPRSSWPQYAQLDNHLGTVWRADALTDLGFDAAGDPSDTWREVEARQAGALGVTRAQVGGPQYLRAATKLELAAELRCRPTGRRFGAVFDRRRRRPIRWANSISHQSWRAPSPSPGSWDNTELISELIEYHSARELSAPSHRFRGPGRKFGDWAAPLLPRFCSTPSRPYR